MTRVAIVDYGMGNRRSVEKAFAHVGAEAVITRDADVIRGAAAPSLARAGVPIARAEGFEAHAASMAARMGHNGAR